MKILKFGGTSLGNPSRMREVLELSYSDNQDIVVLSAISGTTNALQEMCDFLYLKDQNSFYQKVESLKSDYKQFIFGLYEKKEWFKIADDFAETIFNKIKQKADQFFTLKEEREMLSFGEILSTNLFVFMALEQNKRVRIIDALEFMKTDEYNEPDIRYIKNKLSAILTENRETMMVTQGYICRDNEGLISNLKRGGSDYTAALIGEAVNASEVQIWTDIDGMHNNDPRIVEDTLPIRTLSYNEAAELAYFGAKVLHPQCVFPVQRANIPLTIKYTMDPNAAGTTICAHTDNSGIKSIAAKDGITVIKIRSARMLMAYGFLRRVFEIFEKHRTSIDMITTSEVAVSLTIDDDKYLQQILVDLKDLGDVEVEADQTILCIVGDLISDSKGYASLIFNSLKDIPVRMVSYGGSRHNISILIAREHKSAALSLLHENIFEPA